MTIMLRRTGVGTADVGNVPVTDRQGSGFIPMQVQGDGTTTFRVNGKAAPDAPWFTIKAAGTADFLESFSWCPFIQLEITAGTGQVTLWIGDN